MSQANQPSSKPDHTCPDCESDFEFLTLREFFNRRDFVKSAVCGGHVGSRRDGPAQCHHGAAETGATDPKNTAATVVARASTPLPRQNPRKRSSSNCTIRCGRSSAKSGLRLGLHRRPRPAAHAGDNNWNITKPIIGSDFYSKDQQDMMRAIYEGLFQPDWIRHIDKQLADDGGGYGKSQSIALFGHPGEGQVRNGDDRAAFDGAWMGTASTTWRSAGRCLRTCCQRIQREA